MIEYISQHWYAGAALVLLAALTVFAFVMAILSGRKRNAERERIIENIEREKSLRKEFRDINEDTFADDKDDYRLVVGMCTNIQMKIEKIEDMNAAFEQLPEEKKLIYALGYVFEDSRVNLSDFFRANGEPLLSVAAVAVDRIIGDRMQEVFSKEYIMLDENDETTSVDNEKLRILDEEYKQIIAEEGSRIYANAASFVRRNKEIFLQ